MNSTWRLVVFLIFLFAFLISAPLVVLYTAGYRFDVQTGSIVHTGVMSVTSIPRSATVFIDGEQASGRTPAVYDNILPGERLLRLEKTGYTSWEKKLSVKSRETVFVKDVLLFLNEAPRIKDDRTIEFAARSHNNTQLAYLIQEGTWIELWIFNSGSQSEQLLARIPHQENASYDIRWSMDDGSILLTQNGSKNNISIVQVASGKTFASPPLLDQADRVWWDAEDSSLLYAAIGSETYRINAADGIVHLLPYDAHAIMQRGGDFVLSANADRMVLSQYRDNTATIITHIPYSSYQFHAAPSGVIMLEDTQRGRIILIDTEGRDQPILLNTEAKAWHWHTDNNRLVFTDGFDLEVYTRSSHITQTLTRQSEAITSVLWYPLGNAILYATDTRVQSLELESRDGHEVVELATGDIEQFWLDKEGDYLMLLGLFDGQSGIFTRRLQR